MFESLENQGEKMDTKFQGNRIILLLNPDGGVLKALAEQPTEVFVEFSPQAFRPIPTECVYFGDGDTAVTRYLKGAAVPVQVRLGFSSGPGPVRGSADRRQDLWAQVTG